MKENHRCRKINGSESVKIEKLDGRWYLTKTYYADEEMIADGEAEYIDEEISSFSTLIDYCPFCGTDLNASGDDRSLPAMQIRTYPSLSEPQIAAD